jgi:uncharacterized protein
MPIDYKSLGPAERQRLPEYKRDEIWIKDFLHRSAIGHIAHLNGIQPFNTPSNFWYDESRNRIIFHSNIAGRLRSNIESNPLVCFETSEYGRLLPSNAALEFSIQYRSVVVFGKAMIIIEPDEKKAALEALISKYFSIMQSGIDYRPITVKELEQTSVYAIQIDSWSGKENWQNQAEQIPDWPPLPEEIQ